MVRSAQLESQLSAMAAGADRANRPTSLLALPGLLLAFSAAFMLWSFQSTRAAARVADARQSDLKRTAELVAAIRAEEAGAIDLAALYGPMPFFHIQVDESWKADSIPFKEPPVIGAPTGAPVIPVPLVQRFDVQCAVKNEPLETIFAWMDSVQRHKILGGKAFVSQVQLTPSGPGWQASLRFSVYVCERK